ncbi:MAG: VTC domain-containing protein [Fidelibacterota bacterium]
MSAIVFPDRTMTNLPATTRSTLAQFEPVVLQEIKSISLTDRQDTKFTFHIHQLDAVLTLLLPFSRILEVDSCRISNYRNHYFDTSDFNFYLQHHNTTRSRYKVRMRTYPFTDLTFLEVKEKNNRNRTLKSRLLLDEVSLKISPEWYDFISQNSSVDPGSLSRSLDIDFSRITLTDTQLKERLTLDFNFRFDFPKQGLHLNTLVIAEVKQPRYSPSSVFQQSMRLEKANEMRISKYCLGMLLSYPRIKYNRFKPKMRELYRITQNPVYRKAVYPNGYLQ